MYSWRVCTAFSRPFRVSLSKIVVMFKVPEEPIFVHGDGNRIDQVLTNLLTNSVRYTDRGSVDIELRPFEPTSSQLRIVISDTGAGIPADALPRLFERFYKTDPARTGTGTGLGLAIVKHIVRAHRARVEVDSAVGRGSKFRIVLPRWEGRH